MGRDQRHSVLVVYYISAGNKVIPDELAQYLPCAMQNLDAAVKSLSIAIPVTTTVSMTIMGPSYPPSQGVFSNEVSSIMTKITTFLGSRNSPLLVSVYPWFAVARDRVNIPYALFDESAPPVTDGTLICPNLFNAMVDTLYAALEKAEMSTGGNWVADWWSKPCDCQTDRWRFTYLLYSTKISSLRVEQNWGLYNPSATEVYHVDFPIA